jgi:hypothetical protein
MRETLHMDPSLTPADVLARGVIRGLLDGASPEGVSTDQCGPWAEAVEMLYSAHDKGSTPAVKAVFDAITRSTPGLATLVASGTDGPMAGATKIITEMIQAGSGPDVPPIPAIDHAVSLDDLAPFINTILVLPKAKARDKKRAAAHAICRLLLAQGRLLLDTEEGENTGTPYLIGDDDAAWPLSHDLLPVKAMLGKAGLNFSEPAFRWLTGDLSNAAYNEAPRIKLSHYWEAPTSALYISSGPTQMVRAQLDRDAVLLDTLPNGADGVYFASDAVLPAWTPVQKPIPPRAVAAFCPAIIAPPEVPDYTPEVQRLLLTAWLTALVAGIRPLPILAAIGDKGGGKTHLIRAVNMLATLEDPNTVSDEARDLWTLTVRRPVLALDNVDASPAPWLPDLLAAAVTGVTYERRKLYTDNLTERRKVRAAFAVSTRTAAYARPDVAERTLPVITGVFQDADRESDAALISQVRDTRDALLTWLAGQAVHMLNRLPSAPTLPGRFVDFGRVVWAHDPVHAPDALRALQKAQAMTVGDADPLVAALLEHSPRLLSNQGYWEGTPTALTHELEAAGADLPYLGGGKAIARMLREGKGTLALFGVTLSTKQSGNNTNFVLARR